MAHTAFVSEHPGVPRLLFGELQRAGSTTPKRLVAALLREYAERLRTLLERGRDSGELDAHLDILLDVLLAGVATRWASLPAGEPNSGKNGIKRPPAKRK